MLAQWDVCRRGAVSMNGSGTVVRENRQQQRQTCGARERGGIVPFARHGPTEWQPDEH